MAYGDFKDLTRRTACDKILCDKAFNVAKIQSQNYFNIDGAQLYLILQSFYYTLKRLGNTEKVVSWKSKDLSTEKGTTPITTDKSFSPSIK